MYIRPWRDIISAVWLILVRSAERKESEVRSQKSEYEDRTREFSCFLFAPIVCKVRNLHTRLVRVGGLRMLDVAEIYETYYARIYNFIFFKLLHRQITEDLVSEVFLKVVDHIDSYDPTKGEVSTWLYAIASNTLNDYLRRRNKTVSITLDELHDDTKLSVDFSEQSSLIKDEERRELYEALSKLDDRTRDIISEKYFLEKSIRTIAKEKDMNESTVSTLHNRGLAELRKTIII